MPSIPTRRERRPVAPPAARRHAFADEIERLTVGLGGVTLKPMFGGHGVFRHGLMWAIAMGERLYLKVDDRSAHLFDARGLPAFTYTDRHGRSGRLRYHEAPAEVFEDEQALREWAGLAWEAALRAQAGSRRSTAPAVAKRARRAVDQAVGDLADLPNLGPASAAMLAQAGIRTEKALRELGSARAYLRTKAACPRASLTLLWAIEGALSGRTWQAVAAEDRASLLMALEDARRASERGAE